MDFNKLLKKVLPHFIAVVAMLAISSIYFYPAMEGKSLQGHDDIMNYGKWREIDDYDNFEGHRPMWNGALFSGMPEFISTYYYGSTYLDYLYLLPQKMGLPSEVASIFWYMIGFYILMISLGVSPWLALMGAVGFALTSYNSIIIAAGHQKKVDTIALIAPTLAGIMLCFRGKYIPGFILLALFLAMQINMGHVQMTYYFLIGLICIGILELYYSIKLKEHKQFLKSMAVMVLAVVFAIAPNYAELANLYRYNKESIRGKSELTLGKEGIKTKEGLDKDYINAWSSGVYESMMIMVPRVKGGYTAAVGDDKAMLNKAPAQYKDTIRSMNQYWGDQPFSGGPNYIGAVLVFLFVLGAFVVKNRIKIGVLIATILLIMLSWGGHFPAFTNLFIDYLPLYNKFRAPVSILAIAAIFITLLATLTVHEIIQNPKSFIEKRKYSFLPGKHPLGHIVAYAFFLFLVVNIAMPDMFNSFISNAEQDQFQSLITQQGSEKQITAFMNELIQFRISVFRAELWRTLLFCVAAFAFILLYTKKRIKPVLLILAITLLIMADLWSVNRRYVKLKEFSAKDRIAEAYQLTDIDRQIYQMEIQQNPAINEDLLQAFDKFQPKTQEEKDRLMTYIVNKNAHYRVFNVTQSPFNENNTSNAHRSVGGYHAVKLSRYQDMIEHHIGRSNMSVLNMLNTKYFITKEGLQINPGHLGPAWYADTVIWVDEPDDVILALNDFDPSREAVIQSKLKEKVTDFGKPDSADMIQLTAYNPEKMTYTTNTSGSRLAIFSEVYYPDWTIMIDGEKSRLFPVNYILRGAIVPAGQHTVELIFDPVFYHRSNQFSLYASYLFAIVILMLAFWKPLKSVIKPSMAKVPDGQTKTS